MVNSYKALILMFGEDPSAERVTDPNALRERQYRDDYLEEGVRSARSMQMKTRIIDGARRYLEQLYVFTQSGFRFPIGLGVY